VDSAPDAIYWIGPDGRFIYVNEEACRATGYSREELLALTVLEVDPDFSLARLEEHRNGEPPSGDFVLETTHRRKDGSLLPVEVAIRHLEFEGKYYSFAFARDLSRRKRTEAELDGLFEGAPEALAELGGDDTIVRTNHHFSALFGYSREEALGRRVNELLAPGALNEEASRLSSRLMRGQAVAVEAVRRRKDGSNVDVSILAAPIGNDKRIGAYAIYRDISERKERERTLRQSEVKHRALVEAIPDLTLQFDEEGRYLDCKLPVNFETFVQPSEFLGKTMEEVLPAPVAEKGMRALRQALDTGKVQTFEYSMRMVPDDPDSRLRHFEARYVKSGERTVLALVRNVTPRKEYEERLVRQATHDPLTDLPNRAFVINLGTQALALARRQQDRVAVLFIDLDNFKRVNDAVGHLAADQLLKEVADRFSSCVRECDTIGRIGGDEFVVILPGIQRPDEVEATSQRLLAALAKPLCVGGSEFSVTASIGTATYPEDGDDIEDLLQRADTAMYRAKSAGRNVIRKFVPVQGGEVEGPQRGGAPHPGQ